MNKKPLSIEIQKELNLKLVMALEGVKENINFFHSEEDLEGNVFFFGSKVLNGIIYNYQYKIQKEEVKWFEDLEYVNQVSGLWKQVNFEKILIDKSNPIIEKENIYFWEKEYDTFVLDMDGFPNGTSKEDLFTREEFLEYILKSTIKISKKLIEAGQ